MVVFEKLKYEITVSGLGSWIYALEVLLRFPF